MVLRSPTQAEVCGMKVSMAREDASPAVPAREGPSFQQI